MNNKWLLHVRYFLTWILFFIGAKAVFLLYHFSRTGNLSAVEITNIFLYGLRLDASFAAYICIIPFFLFLIKALLPSLPIFNLIKYYTWFLLGFLALLTVIDLELYNAWGF